MADGKQLRLTTSALSAGHLAWIAMFCSILSWRVGEVRPPALGDVGNSYRIMLVLLAAAAALFGLLRNANRLSQAFPSPLILLGCYAVLGMISSLYIPAHSFYSMWKGFEVMVDVMAIAAVLSSAQPQDSARIAYKIIVTLFGVLMVLYLVEALLMPSAAFLPSRGIIPYTIEGVSPVMNGNSLAFLSAVTGFAAWCRLLKARSKVGKLVSLLLLMLALVTLILAQSRTSLIGLVTAICVQLFFDRRFVLLVLTLGLGAVLATSTQFTDVADEYLVRGQSKELFTSLSGRTQGWEAAWASFQQSPVIGHGFAAAARAEILGTTGASTLHGAIFDVIVGVGLLGLIPWVAAILWTSLRLLRLARRGHSRWENATLNRSARAEMLGVLSLILVRSTTSSGLAMHEHDFMLFLAVLAFASAALRPLRQRVPAASSRQSIASTAGNSVSAPMR